MSNAAANSGRGGRASRKSKASEWLIDGSSGKRARASNGDSGARSPGGSNWLPEAPRKPAAKKKAAAKRKPAAKKRAARKKPAAKKRAAR